MTAARATVVRNLIRRRGKAPSPSLFGVCGGASSSSRSAVGFGGSSLFGNDTSAVRAGTRAWSSSSSPSPPHRPSSLPSTTIRRMPAPARRTFARSSTPCDETPEDKARTFLLTVGYEPDLADGIVAALRESGLSGEALLSTIRSMAGRWEVGEDEGLEALAGSVRQQLAARDGKSTVKFWVVPPNAWDSGETEKEGGSAPKPLEEEGDEDREVMMTRAFEVEALEGTSITDVAKFGTSSGASTLGEYIECACSGIMACSTCHVVIDPKWHERVGKACEDEQDMLDLAYGPRETSRLGCQVVLTKEMDGLVVRIPGGANNLMDFVPFEG
eukprot:CAMPEP_0113540130 /NCGR_PEP_ID=MMETSP0015_2-20120614/8311_1 /TAXON_ID=2838 /ORGANISM="Odontella" /LENGTH=328 /DNA_ID=CAMNT_0000439903 /DNA_START=79 /DNA_END=1065 /DNA_ORIENTATION=+ /assembly_acc=CAM_ASM_000160